MSDIANLANHVVIPPPPGPTTLDSKPSATSQNADFYHPDHLPPESTKPLDQQYPSTGATRPDEDTTLTDQVGETDTGNFRDVLEKRLSEKSDPKPPSEQYQNTSDSDESSSGQKPAPVRSPENTNPELVANKELPADLAQLKLTQTTGGPTMPSHHVIVALPAKVVTGKEVEPGVAVPVPTRTHLLSRVVPDVHNPAKGKQLQAEQIKTDANAQQTSAKPQTLQAQTLKNDTTGGLATTFVKYDGDKDTGPNVKKTVAKTTTVKARNLSLSNKKAGADQNQTRLHITDSTTKKPVQNIDPKPIKDQNADILTENSKTDALLATAKLPTTDAKNPAIDSISPTSAPKGGTEGIRTATGKNQTLAASNGAQSTTQKGTSDIQAASAAARTNAVVADTDGSGPTAVEATNLAAKVTDVSSALNARWNNSVNNARQTVAGPSSGTIQNEGNIQPSPAQQIIDGIRLNINTNHQQIYISLNPPELGRVAIMFRHTDGEITGILKVENQETKYDIEKALPQIAASIQQSGVQVGRVNVIINDQNQQGPLKNNDMPNDDFTGMTKHGFTDQSSDGNSAKTNSPQHDSTGHVTQQPSDIKNEITDNTINVYA